MQIPFRKKVTPGSSEFEIGVPEEWINDYEFFFSNIHLVPDYFSRMATQYELDPARELELQRSLDLRVRVCYPVVKAVVPSYTLSASTPPLMTYRFVAAFNNHFFANKNTHQRFCGVFMDWCPKDVYQDPDGYVLDRNGAFYPSPDAYDEDKHYGKLPDPEVRKFPWVNNYTLPINEKVLTSQVRLRICLAPKTSLYCSNLTIFKSLGFNEVDLGPLMKATGSQDLLVNDTEDWKIFRASLPPPILFVHKANCKFACAPSAAVVVAVAEPVELSVEQWGDNAEVVEAMNRSLEAVGDVLNVKLSVLYDSDTFKFKFAFPSDGKMEASLEMDPELSNRLGFGVGSAIDRFAVGEPRDTTQKVVDAHLMSQALVMDTGNVNVYLADAPSNTLKGDAGFLMADLYPDPQGLLKPLHGVCEPAATQVVTRLKDTENRVLLRFRLGRVYELGNVDRFEWRTAAYVFGTLSGRPLATV